ncbi:AbrB/MazE/SpoVT family DNA-binding domain-containing protein [Candidatus Peregrinibacteria bacterium]|nr:AbrB/MazE/SpoVT family DNA-binding domain-containing protein [Candidatus Peregrinibacteria bacterium]
MSTKISKCTEKGQITLPKDWRDLFKTDSFMIQYDQKKLIITPINLSELQEEVIFDAEKDNNGKGISVDEMIKTLKKIKHG